jgi:subtilisin family serine protease
MVIDSGIDYLHPDLSGNLDMGRALNADGIFPRSIVGPGNVRSFDSYSQDMRNRLIMDEGFESPLLIPYHGTVVTGIIGAVGKNKPVGATIFGWTPGSQWASIGV